MYQRKQIFKNSEEESLFLWGARQSGKTTLLKEKFPDALFIDLLLSNEYEQLLRNPSLLRERVLAFPKEKVIVIDEVQRLPNLLNEVHWLIENRGNLFILCGSSPRKIIHSGENLLGGRALRYHLYPLVSAEINDFDLARAINQGTLPRHYLSNIPAKLTSAYIGNYLKDEILAEARIRNIAAFSSFFEAAAFSNGKIVNYQNIASDCGVSAKTVKDYFTILQETLIGHFVPSFQKRPKRRVILAPKFYFFDLGITNYLLKRGTISMEGELFGKAFEHFIFLELLAHSSYSDLHYPIYYWRTASGLEVDFIIGNQIALEVKGKKNITAKDLKNLKQFAEEYPEFRLMLVSNESWPRQHENITILPWKDFLYQLWKGE
ncbi:MAG TPA: ATP-binding protein, partial [Candidatus Marinimicrobia bacterium]|nr:ATP-binding protein [Candidatus Neomarinimicrobiota bacterium]